MSLEDYSAIDRLDDGTMIVVRAVRPSDKDLMRQAFARQSDDSLYYRFLTPKNELRDDELRYFTEVDFQTHVALSVFIGNEAVAVGRFVVDSEHDEPKIAEIAVIVDEKHQGKGIGTILLRHLVHIAHSLGVEQLEATVLGSNRRMMQLLEHSGLPMNRALDENGIWEIQLGI